MFFGCLVPIRIAEHFTPYGVGDLLHCSLQTFNSYGVNNPRSGWRSLADKHQTEPLPRISGNRHFVFGGCRPTPRGFTSMDWLRPRVRGLTRGFTPASRLTPETHLALSFTEPRSHKLYCRIVQMNKDTFAFRLCDDAHRFEHQLVKPPSIRARHFLKDRVNRTP
jgi:hypothetical protein